MIVPPPPPYIGISFLVSVTAPSPSPFNLFFTPPFMLQAAIEHTNVPNKLSKEHLTTLKELPGLLESLDPAQPDQVDLKVNEQHTTTDVPVVDMIYIGGVSFSSL